MELRCPNGILHGIVTSDFVEMACRSSRCGKRPGNIVLHKFSKSTGELLETKVFQNPTPKEVNHGNRSEQGSSLRAS